MTAPRLSMVSPNQPPEVPTRRLLSVDEAAHALHISGRFLRDLIKRGDVTAVRLGRRVLLSRGEVERLATEGAR